MLSIVRAQIVLCLASLVARWDLGRGFWPGDWAREVLREDAQARCPETKQEKSPASERRPVPPSPPAPASPAVPAPPPEPLVAGGEVPGMDVEWVTTAVHVAKLIRPISCIHGEHIGGVVVVIRVGVPPGPGSEVYDESGGHRELTREEWELCRAEGVKLVPYDLARRMRATYSPWRQTGAVS